MNNIIQEILKISKDLKLLYVEDNEEARNSTLNFLSRFFDDIVVAVDGEDGLKKFLESKSRFDLILTDITMPKMDGLEMVKQIKEKNHDIMILVLSANNESSYFLDAIKLGIDGYLLKPLNMQQMIRQLFKTLEKIKLKKENETYKRDLEKKIHDRTIEMIYQTYHDGLTGLKNKDFVSLFFLNIDNFEDYSEIFGIDGGNKILKAFSSILTVTKHEILMRMQKEVDGKTELVSPIFFLDIAKKTKQYQELSNIMAKKGFEVVKNHEGSFSFNVSFEDIVCKSTVQMLKSLIETHDIGKRVILEIVESEIIEDYSIVKNFIDDFRSYGVKVAIDDFGSGYSNFQHIIEIKPDYLKFDGSLIKDINTSTELYEFVKSVVGLTKALGIKTIAEFIHSEKVFDICHELGVDEFQGFYFSPPVVESEIKEDKVIFA